MIFFYKKKKRECKVNYCVEGVSDKPRDEMRRTSYFPSQLGLSCFTLKKKLSASLHRSSQRIHDPTDYHWTRVSRLEF